MVEVAINLETNKSFMKISEMLFQRYTMLNKDKTLQYILDCYDKDANKKNIKYMISFKNHSWKFLEGDYPDKIFYANPEFYQSLRYTNLL
jgi:hypothetical protein